MSEEWSAYNYRRIGDEKASITEITGAVAPLFTKGPRVGNKNWSKRDKTTEKTAYFTDSQPKVCSKKTTASLRLTK